MLSEDAQAYREVEARLNESAVFNFNAEVLQKIYSRTHKIDYTLDEAKNRLREGQRLCYRHGIMKHMPFAAPHVVAALDTHDYLVIWSELRASRVVFDVDGTQPVSYIENGKKKKLTFPMSHLRVRFFKKGKPDAFLINDAFVFEVSQQAAEGLVGRPLPQPLEPRGHEGALIEQNYRPGGSGVSKVLACEAYKQNGSKPVRRTQAFLPGFVRPIDPHFRPK